MNAMPAGPRVEATPAPSLISTTTANAKGRATFWREGPATSLNALHPSCLLLPACLLLSLPLLPTCYCPPACYSLYPSSLPVTARHTCWWV